MVLTSFLQSFEDPALFSFTLEWAIVDAPLSRIDCSGRAKSEMNSIILITMRQLGFFDFTSIKRCCCPFSIANKLNIARNFGLRRCCSQYDITAIIIWSSFYLSVFWMLKKTCMHAHDKEITGKYRCDNHKQPKNASLTSKFGKRKLWPNVIIWELLIFYWFNQFIAKWSLIASITNAWFGTNACTIFAFCATRHTFNPICNVSV